MYFYIIGYKETNLIIIISVSKVYDISVPSISLILFQPVSIQILLSKFVQYWEKEREKDMTGLQNGCKILRWLQESAIFEKNVKWHGSEKQFWDLDLVLNLVLALKDVVMMKKSMYLYHAKFSTSEIYKKVKVSSTLGKFLNVELKC